jgi:isocitrate/isopropylmalate dehydrogenase
VSRSRSGGAARFARSGVVYTEEDFALCRAADAILLGELGLPDVLHRNGTEAGPDQIKRVYVDAFCAQMVLYPTSIHVAVAENMFGDIISDLAAGLVGSLGRAPSGDIGDQHCLFQPSHGSPPTIAGKDEANPLATNPLATILSAAMMLDWLAQRKSSIGSAGMADDIRAAVDKSIGDWSSRTRDIGGTAGTRACTEAVIGHLCGPETAKRGRSLDRPWERLREPQDGLRGLTLVASRP